MTVQDVEDAVGGDRDATVVYVCGVPAMTDEFVGALVSPEGFGIDRTRVLFEKWW
jgi:NAD(P)H-flavin reductase